MSDEHKSGEHRPDEHSVVLTRCFHSWEAEILHGVLDDAGIPSTVSSHADGLGGAITDTSSGFMLLVNESDLERAREAIAESRAAGKELPEGENDEATESKE